MAHPLRHLNSRLFMLKKLLFVLLLLALDIRDVFYKLAWIGPTDTYSFRAGSRGVLHTAPLISNVTSESRALDGGEHVVSGWSSFLSRCEELHAIGARGESFFLSAMGKNCVVRVAGGNNETRVIPQLVMTSSIRADAPIWASCLFLHLGRRPPVCQDHIATHFNQRYAFSATKIRNSDVAPIGSDAEAEILRFLDLISTSVPLCRVVCVEAFELVEESTGTFTANLFGCASPNVFRSEFVGFSAKQYKRLLHGKAWLTNDEISLLGMQFGVRQNAKSDYVVSRDSEPGLFTLRSKTSVNFSSYGPLYALMVAIDMWLLLTHCQSVFEILKWMLFPKYRELQHWAREFETSHDSRMVVPENLVRQQEQQQQHGRREQSLRQQQYHQQEQPQDSRKHHGSTVVFREERFYAFFSASYYKSPTYVWLVRLTRVISWIIIMPNSVVWTWSDSQNEKFQAYLSSVKVWVLISGALQALWHAVVRMSEARAYQFARRTYITNLEIIVIGALAAVALQDEIFLICEEKWAIENQRVNDAASFIGGYIAHGNTFQRENDYRTTTPFEIVRILYAPLIHIVLLSIAAAAAWLLVKFAFFATMARVEAKERRRRDVVVVSTGSSGVSDPATTSNRFNGGAPASSQSGQSDGSTSDDNHHDHSSGTREPYARLPLEDALDIPIRASSLVRNGLSMEIVRDGRRYIRPSCYLDYGIMLKHGAARTHIDIAEIFRNNRMLSKDTGSEFASMARQRQARSTASLLSSSSRTHMLFQASALASQDALVSDFRPTEYIKAMGDEGCCKSARSGGSPDLERTSPSSSSSQPARISKRSAC